MKGHEEKQAWIGVPERNRGHGLGAVGDGFLGTIANHSQFAGALRQPAYGGPSTPEVGSAALRVLRVARSALRAFVVNLFSYLHIFLFKFLRGKTRI